MFGRSDALLYERGCIKTIDSFSLGGELSFEGDSTCIKGSVSRELVVFSGRRIPEFTTFLFMASISDLSGEREAYRIG